jgi:hypothetical protein
MGIFDGLEQLGFDVSNELQLFPTEETEKAKKEETPENPMDYLIVKNTVCPVCNSAFDSIVIRKSKLKLIDVETDFKAHYQTIDPNLYDILICHYCGYASMSNLFAQITDKQIDIVKQKIRPHFIARDYYIPFSVECAIERYKLALLCATVIGRKAGYKALLCLKLAWLYRDLGDRDNEAIFIRNAALGYKEAYKTESFPIGAMNEATTQYIIAELLRRDGQFSEAMRWISEVVVARSGVTRKLKDRALLVKDLIRDRSTT